MSRTQVFIVNVNAVIDSGEFKHKEVADAAGINAKDLSRLLNGRRDSCTLDRAEAICIALDIPWEQLTSESFLEIAAT